jgi:hypothetical protein
MEHWQRFGCCLHSPRQRSFDAHPCLHSPFACSPAGTFLTPGDQGCQTCPDDSYRTGDATPENNECKPIPPGAFAASCAAPL